MPRSGVAAQWSRMLLTGGKRWGILTLLCLVATGLLYNSKWNLYLLWPRGFHDCNCRKCLTEGEHEFKALMDASPKPFLTKQNPTSEDDFDWWKKIQRETRPFSFFNETVDKLFTILPPNPGVEQQSPYRCRSCAVVGNSGNLKGSHYGPLIDHHHIVIRMNYGRTKGYESDVGTKTTYHIMYPESAIFLDNNTRLIFFPFKIKDLLWLLKNFAPQENGQKNPKRRANKDLVMILNPAFMKYVHTMWLEKKGRYPSTGFMALLLSLQICDEVNVFGFGADGDGNWNHYFEILKNKKLKTGPHAGTHEYDVIQKLYEKEIINFFKGQ
ncbi:CMP-N-acetylneuraminate-beta-galactosamide-alpha-2,3-sialyltransferase 1-like isoform X1 [Corythoichthys intestinalis]|uniref:CMP-N-acetylneuraminate-beta-galactosamide- alpha-2,3-sialyltransferase 1-like isoform X1 n=2 Tax=Corythoichthys intestinalis TaxID=161448 RepID=UPI0025A556D7|nr:CMP-N-acetylneuraminate-beta-galactosamide-alpha-2,3-sialyltransferase 1-like isoform X1 [Corythoichthys intestinalis]XP_057684665.1 CMP-N-acetylneuraminate-beta-galactosamide-alpha-2,3-sialyltransferase 1-like isoform X1 [Corythoichthys intestinalis]XP_057684666.1 CMP-N-acetylneuraminate-beta-galactosamide-alpha-2,3-sialyltransferase 1-like isoform X1 [Corythoichthys intestinalis]XP_057684667.1 CMP-N-acetylneuraminate-beta-galactosamide-alpha-2,3-sialyltransferase 1-like isoform X1 [Corythoi